MSVLAEVEGALVTIAVAADADPSLHDALRARWRQTSGDIVVAPSEPIDAHVAAAADYVAAEVPSLLATPETLAPILGGDGAVALLAFCSASTFRSDVVLAPILALAARAPATADYVASVAHDRVVEGPLVDALACAPFIGDGTRLRLPEYGQGRARLEILIWEAGSSALEVPHLGRWIWSSPETFDALVREPAHGPLRGRVLAARCLEVSVGGMPPTTDPALVGKTLQILQPLLLHPEPLVWVHAARALGRLCGAMEQLENTVLDWVLGESKLLRQRATTAFASLPAARLRFLATQLVALLDSPAEEAWVLAAVAAATPYLFYERKPLWDRLAARILSGDGGAIAARALARGLATLWRRGTHDTDVEVPLRALRDMGRRARAESLDDLRRWIEVISVTDVVDGAERDPLDLELGIENLVRVAAQYDDREADARAARFATSLATTFVEARRVALGHGRLRVRAAAINALEGCARTFALQLWAPLLATSPAGDEVDEPDLEETWRAIAAAPAEILALVEERRNDDDDEHVNLALEILAVRLGGYALDACGEDAALGPGRGPTAHDTCLWLRKLDGLADGSRVLPDSLKNALSTLFWRLVDTTRGTALGEVDDTKWLGPFAAWWALVIDRPAMLLQVANALPLLTEGALEQCCARADVLREAMFSQRENGTWGDAVVEALAGLNAEGTELAEALAGLSHAIAAFATVSGARADLEPSCLALVLAGERLQGALANPVKALHPASAQGAEDSLSRAATENAPRVAALVARAIRTRDISMLDVWLASLGPVTSNLLEAAVQAAIRRSPPPPPTKKQEVKVIEGYELVKPLGEGGIGRVWLVRKPGADRLFVLKIPKADALASANDVERAGILASFVEEAKALAGLYHPNVANIIDRGVSGDVPFLVLEYLIGADLKEYATAGKMSLFELRQVVIETCAGLSSLHAAGLVHRDLKPANIWLRLPLAGGERFDSVKHRDPARTPPLSAVVIDFGMVRATRVSPDTSGRFVAGTAGYIAPEQVLDPIELDVRSDVYALAGTVYNCVTGRSFFDEIESARDRIIAHMRRDPFEDAERLRGFPTAMVKLLRAATALDPAQRPSPLEFSREFTAAL